MEREAQAVGATQPHIAHDGNAPGELTKMQLDCSPREPGILADFADRRPTSAFVVRARREREENELWSRLKSKFAHELDMLPRHSDADYYRRDRSDVCDDSK